MHALRVLSPVVMKTLFPLLVAVVLMTPGRASATAQASDKLIYKGETVYIFSNPLESFFDSSHRRPHLPPGSTACWRGYIATWKIENDCLYLVRMQDCTSEKEEIPLSMIFQDRPAPVRADWFSGTLRIPQGKMLRYVHMGYGSIFEREVFLTIEKGKLVSEQVVDNTKTRLPSENERAVDELIKLKEWEDNTRKSQE